ncbi:MAG: ribonuclease J [Oscillospiraceae bacterium]|nr:ribonuclease J [Oscillospiraceae bacterium]
MTDLLTQAINKVIGNTQPEPQSVPETKKEQQPQQRKPQRPRPPKPQTQQPQQTAAGSHAKPQPVAKKSVPQTAKNPTAQSQNNTAKQAPAAAKAPSPANKPQMRKPQPRNNQKGRKNVPSKAAGIPLTIRPLGGLGEVGKNITLYECQNDMFLVDCGTVFPDNEMFGVDLVIPDFTTVLQNKDKIKGLVITHGHEDHIGAIPYLLRQFNVPIYGTRLTLGLITNKLTEHGLASSAKLIEIRPKEKFKLGCFTIEPIHVNHSIPDAVALAIESPAGTVIQTGDFKIDYTPITDETTDLSAFAAYGQKGVIALLSDSTNAERPGCSASERKVGEAFQLLFSKAEDKRIVIATFASNLQRIQQIFDLAVKHGRKVAVSGRSMINNTQMALELGYLKAPEDLMIEIEAVNKYPPEKIVIVTTGSQGEPLSALTRMSGGSHRQVRIGEGDFIIISAKPIPGNEKMVGRVVNGLLKLGAEVIYESMYDVHTSGHACQDEQKLILELVKPKYFIPVHGEYKQLYKHAKLGESMGIPKQNILISDIGETIIMDNQSIRRGEPVQAGRILVDGLGVGDIGNVVLRDRRHLSQDGLVIVVATIDTATGEVLSGPDIVSRGFVYVRESEQLIDEARIVVREIFEQCRNEGLVNDWASVKARIREQLSSMMYRRTKRSPMILPILMEI